MPTRRPSIVSYLVGLALLAGIAGTACRERQKPAGPAPATAAPAIPPAIEDPTLETLYGILGQAEAANAGVSGLQGGAPEWVVTYRFPAAREKGLEERLGAEMAPKIQALYDRYRDLDRVVFKVEVFEKRDPDAWKPYCSFVTTRRSIDDIDWINLPLTDFIKRVSELKIAG
jgi:hypothetical protein